MMTVIMHLLSIILRWMHNDVALIKLSRPAELNQRVNLVCLPSPGEDEQVTLTRNAISMGCLLATTIWEISIGPTVSSLLRKIRRKEK